MLYLPEGGKPGQGMLYLPEGVEPLNLALWLASLKAPLQCSTPRRCTVCIKLKCSSRKGTLKCSVSPNLPSRQRPAEQSELGEGKETPS